MKENRPPTDYDFHALFWRKKSVLTSVAALLLLSGCAAINDAVVRHWLMEPGLSGRVNSQIREGLERRKSSPPARGPGFPAPEFLDQG
jgi:hypothetical protein